MQDQYTSEDHIEMVRVISKLYFHQSEEKLGQTIDQFRIESERFWSRTGSFQTSSIWTSSAIKDVKSHLWHNMCAKLFTKVPGICWLPSYIKHYWHQDF